MSVLIPGPHQLPTILLFLAICLGLGFGAVRLGPRRGWPDRWLLSLVTGLGLLPPLIFLLRLLHVPLRWWVLLAGAGLGPAVAILRRRTARRAARPGSRTALARRSEKRGPGTSPVSRVIIAVLAAVWLTGMLYVGAARNPWLEDDDSWSHAVGAHYVAKFATTAQPYPPISHYLEPYPPYYTAIMGVLHQTQPDLQWTLKFFNALIVGLSLIGAFYAFERMTGDSRKATVATVILGILPAYMSHFIWSQTLAVPVFLVAMWACASLEEHPHRLRDGAFWTATVLVWSATFIQPSTAAVFALFFATYGAIVAWSRARERQPFPWSLALAIAGGGVLSLLSWLFLIGTHGWRHFAEIILIRPAMFTPGNTEDSSGGRIYSLADFLFPKILSDIQQGAGLGWLVCILALAGVVLVVLRWRQLLTTRVAGWTTLLIWLAVGLVGVEGNALPVKLFPHRFWVFLAIPVAALCAEAVVATADRLKNPRARSGAAACLVAGVIVTSYVPRVGLQQSLWRPGADWLGDNELAAYLPLKKLPPQTRTFALCRGQDRLIGMNQDSEPWSPGIQTLQRNLATLTGDDIQTFMSRERYEYIVIDERCLSIGRERLIELQESMLGSGAFDVFVNGHGVLVLRLKSTR